MDFRKNQLLLLCLVLPLTLADAWSVEYMAPNFRKEIFDPDSVLIGRAERQELCSALTAVAANFPVDESGVSSQLKEMALAIALRLDASNPEAQSTHRNLVKKVRPTKLDAFTTKAAIAEKLRQGALLISDAEAVDDEKILSCYLLDIARHLDPLNTEGVGLLKSATEKTKYPGWTLILNSTVGDNGFLFPTEGEADPNAMPPNDPPGDTPPAVAGDPANDLKADKSEARFLGYMENPSGAMTGTVVTLSLEADAAIQEAGQPVRVLFPVPPLKDENPLSNTSDNIITAMSRVHEDWPASGRKIVARFSPEYLPLNKRSGELAVALALDDLYTGMPSGPETVAIGSVAEGGALGKVDGLRRRLRYLQKSAQCERLVVPSENANDLTDILIAGDLKPLLRVQVLEAGTLEEALRISRGNFTSAEQKALLDFAEIRAVAGRSENPVEIIQTDIVKSRLAEIVDAAPFHVSAAGLLRFAKGDLPSKLSTKGSEDELRTAIFPYTRLIKSRELISAAQAESLRVRTNTRLTALRDKLATEAVPLGDKINDYARNTEDFAKLNSKTSAKALDLKASLESAWETINEELKALGQGGQPGVSLNENQ